MADAVDEINAVFSKEVFSHFKSINIKYNNLIFQIVAVFVSAIILKIFTIYFIIKIVTLDLNIDYWSGSFLSLWNMFIVIPSIFAIYLSAITTDQGRKLFKEIGKYSNFCNNDGTLNRVRKFYIF